jgi:hypothetical protein
LLRAFIATYQQQDQATPCLRVVKAIARAIFNSGFSYTVTHRFDIAQIAASHSVDANHNPGLCLPIRQRTQPSDIGFHIMSDAINLDVEHVL